MRRVLFLLACSALAAQVSTKPAPVLFEGRTLFEIRTSLGPFTASERAAAVGQRLQSIAGDPLAARRIHTAEAREITNIMAGDLVLTTVTDADASAAGLTRRALAAEQAARIQVALDQHLKAHAFHSLALGAVYAALATAVFLLILYVLRKLFPRLQRKVRAWEGVQIRSLRIQNLELLPASRVVHALLAALSAIQIVATLALIYFYVPLVFSFFPWTRGYAYVLFDYILNPAKALWSSFLSYVPSVFTILVIAFVTRYIIKLVKAVFTGIARGAIMFRGFDSEWAEPTYKIVRFLILALAAIAIYPYVPGSDSPAFRGISVFLGILLSLGSAGAVSNLIAGVMLTYTRAFRVGDRVRIAETTGDVLDKTLLVTRIRTIKNEDVSIPNSLVLSSHVVNYSACARPGLNGLIVHTSVTIGYDAPWRTVHRLLIEAAEATSGILAEPAPFVLQTSLNDFFVTYEINAYTAQPSRMANIYSDLHQNIQDKFNEAGVEIMSPHYTSIRDGNGVAIPQQYQSERCRPRAFRILHTDQADPVTTKS
jgi:small-conductance mechanosensitive channel